MKVEAKQPNILFTRDGKPLPPPIPAPPGANDFEFFWHEGRIVEAWWTVDGERIEPMPLPPGDFAVHALLGTEPESK